MKFGVTLTSSEKIDSCGRYKHFNLYSIPYPGCEFFAVYARYEHVGAGLRFNWEHPRHDARLDIASGLVDDVDWFAYKQWDLDQLTQNYLLLMLNSLLKNREGGILVHCISGWDRTPLFVSLLRLSLWADGLLHPTLDAGDVLFLTVVYDWFLFEHQFADRMEKGEDIFYFCFDFLKHITGDGFSAAPPGDRPVDRASKLSEVRALALSCYSVANSRLKAHWNNSKRMKRLHF